MLAMRLVASYRQHCFLALTSWIGMLALRWVSAVTIQGDVAHWEKMQPPVLPHQPHTLLYQKGSQTAGFLSSGLLLPQHPYDKH